MKRSRSPEGWEEIDLHNRARVSWWGNQRVKIESLIARWRGLHGGELKSRSEERIVKEVKAQALILNKMIGQGKGV